MSKKKNHLMEAAAEVLAKSISNAPKMPMPTMDGAEKKDIGGDTMTHHSDEKLDATAGVPTATPPGKTPPVGSEPMPHLEKDGSQLSEDKDDDDDKDDDKDDKKKKSDDDEDDDEDDEDSKKMEEAWKKSLSEDVAAILASESSLSESFRKKAATIYEARVIDRVNQIVEQLEKDYVEALEESIVSLRDQFAEQIDQYLNYVVENWMKENEVAVETGLRAELTEEFIAGLKNLFAEHYIDVPAEKVDLVEELAGKVADLESQLNEEIKRGMGYKQEIIEGKKNEVLSTVCEGLTQTQVEKVRSLAESVEFTAEGEYKEKLQTIRENFFPTGVKTSNDATKVLTEATEPAGSDEKKPQAISPDVAHYVQALGRISN